MTSRTIRAAVAAMVLAVVLAGCSVIDQLPIPGRQSSAPVNTGPTQAPTTASPSASTPVPSGSPSPTVARTTATVPEVTPQGFANPPAGEGLQRYIKQDVRWQSCGERVECAEILVPLDYEKPDETAITLAVKRSSGGSGVEGSLFVNPGGPGGSGWDMVEQYAGTFSGTFDVVGWDPRGVGRSTPVQCQNGKSLDVFYGLDSSPDDEQERQELIKGTREFTLSCLEKSGALLEHVSTVETVKDLDLLRQLLGDDKLNFLGFSYGTGLGATYAQLFADKVGRMVLDSAVNITDDNTIIQAQGFDRSLEHFAEWCAEGNCEFGGSKEAVISKITGLWDDLDANPLQVGDRELTQSLAMLGVLTPLYQDEQVWPYLRQGLSQAFNGDGSSLLQFADLYNQRSDSGEYGQMLFAFNAVRCLDEGEGGVAGAEKEAAADAKKAKIFGPYMGADLVCPLWPVAANEPIGKLTGTGAAPILVVGTTGDSATPYEYAQWMAAQLESGVLLTFKGEGHGAFGGDSECVNSTVMTYLTSGTPPEDGKVCS